MKIVITIAGLDAKYGGPSETVPALGRALATSGVEVNLISLSSAPGASTQETSQDGYAQTIIRTGKARFRSTKWILPFRNAIRNATSGCSAAILYDVGLWLPSNHIATQLAWRLRLPLVISPRGMLSDQALKISKWRKRVAWILYQRRDLFRASACHATSANEIRDIRKRGFTSPVAHIPNGVDPPRIPERIDDGTRPVSSNARRTALFLSRHHPIKGLKDLVTAWAEVRPKGWRAVIAGPDECGHRAEVEALVDSLGLRPCFSFPGAVAGEAKRKLYYEADLFVLPSYSESFGQVVAEALAAGVPVISTKATPWRELEEQGCGWWVDTGAKAIARALAEATSCDELALRAMGSRGVQLIRTRYSWEAVADRMLKLFDSVLAGAHHR